MTTRDLNKLRRKIRTDDIGIGLNKRLAPYTTDTGDYDPVKLYQGMKSGALSREFLNAYFGEDTVTGLETSMSQYQAQQDKYSSELKVLEPFKIEGDQYDINKAFYGGISHNLLTRYFGEDVVNQLTAEITQPKDIKITDVLETPIVEPKQDLTPENIQYYAGGQMQTFVKPTFENTVLPALPKELQDQYKVNQRAKFLTSEFDAGRFETALVDEYNQLETTTDEDFKEQVTTWQAMKQEELTNLVTTVFPEFLNAPEGKVDTVVTNYLNTLYTDETISTAFLDRINQLGRNADTEALVKDILPQATERDIKQLFGENVTPLNELPLGTYKITEQPLQDVVDFANKDYEGFRRAVRYEGRTPETEALLNEGYGRTLTEQELNKFFESGVADDFIQGKWLPKQLEDYWDMSMQGIGDILTMVGGMADRFGNDALAKELQLMGSYGQVFSKDVKIAEKYTPQWFAQNMARMAPLMLGLMGVSVITGGLAGAGIAAAGGGTFLQAAGSSVLAGVTSSIGEGMLEAGDAFNEAKRRGFTDDEANKVFDKVFQQNVAGLSASNIAQYGLTFFVPGGRTASFMVKALTYGFDVASEGAEEAGQLYIQRGALGDAQKFDSEMLQNFVLGAAGGLGFAGIGTVHNTIISKIEGKMNPDQYNQLRKRITEFMGQGMSRKEAESKAWDEFAVTPEGETMVNEAVDEVKAEETATIQEQKPQVIAAIKEMTDTVEPVDAKVDALVEELTKPEATTEKQPWQMTGQEYMKSKKVTFDTVADQTKYDATKQTEARKNHEVFVRRALAEGKPVPANVLKDYPNLQKQYPQAAKAKVETKPDTISKMKQISSEIEADISIAKKGFKDVRTPETKLAQLAIRDAEKLSEQANRLIERLRKGQEVSKEEIATLQDKIRSLKDFYKYDKLTGEETRVALVKYIRSNLPISERGRLLTDVKNAKTPDDLKQVISKIDAWTHETERKELQADIRNAIESTKGKKKDGIVRGKFTAEV